MEELIESLSKASSSHGDDGEYNLLESEALYCYRHYDITLYENILNFRCCEYETVNADPSGRAVRGVSLRL